MYAGKWQVKSERAFSDEEKARVSHNEVVASEFGKSVCFFMKDGRQGYIPLDKESELLIGIGASIDMNTSTLLTLSRIGDADIQRVKVNL